MVKELLCAPVDLDRALAQVAAPHPAGRYILRLPAWDKGFGGQVLWGAVRWLSNSTGRRLGGPQGRMPISGWLLTEQAERARKNQGPNL